MKAGNVDQSRLFQQTICHLSEKNWSFSVAWGYSAHIYERIMARSWLMTPIETFEKWQRSPNPPHFMFNTRRPFGDPCEAPHVFFFESIEKTSGNEILTIYTRSKPRNLSVCGVSGSNSADYISKIHVYSPAIKRIEVSYFFIDNVLPPHYFLMDIYIWSIVFFCFLFFSFCRLIGLSAVMLLVLMTLARRRSNSGNAWQMRLLHSSNGLMEIRK